MLWKTLEEMFWNWTCMELTFLFICYLSSLSPSDQLRLLLALGHVEYSCFHLTNTWPFIVPLSILFCPLFFLSSLFPVFFSFYFCWNCLCHILFLFLLEGILCKPFFSLYFSNDLYLNGNISHYPLMKNGLVECFHSALSLSAVLP